MDEVTPFIIRIALWLSAIWDLITTFLGTLLILGGNGFIQIGISLVGTVITGAFNFATKPIWKTNVSPRADPLAVGLLRCVWFFAVCFDFITSLFCNATYVAYQGLSIGQAPVSFMDVVRNLNGAQVLVVFFITVLCTASPMIFSYLRNQETDYFGR